MTFSSFATLQEFGYLTAITMAMCLATDVLMLPAMVVKLQKLASPASARLRASLGRESADPA
jgi:predicted RND superfamily exporter protein